MATLQSSTTHGDGEADLFRLGSDVGAGSMPLMRSCASDIFARSAIVGAAIAFGVLAGLAFDAIEVNAPYLSLLPGVVISSLLGGFRLGAVATILSGGSLRYFFVEPCYSLGLPKVSDSLHILLFLGVSLLICYAIDMLIRSNDALSRDNFVLGHKVFVLLREMRSKAHEKGHHQNR
jgi:hypothetical protein